MHLQVDTDRAAKRIQEQAHCRRTLVEEATNGPDAAPDVFGKAHGLRRVSAHLDSVQGSVDCGTNG
jgi:hypothetical protein